MFWTLADIVWGRVLWYTSAFGIWSWTVCDPGFFASENIFEKSYSSKVLVSTTIERYVTLAFMCLLVVLWADTCALISWSRLSTHYYIKGPFCESEFFANNKENENVKLSIAMFLASQHLHILRFKNVRKRAFATLSQTAIWKLSQNVCDVSNIFTILAIFTKLLTASDISAIVKVSDAERIKMLLANI